MSIIERALGKQRGSAQPAEDSKVRRNIRSRDAIISAVQRSGEARPPRHSIQVDVEALRAAGMLPPHDSSERLIEQFRRIKWPLLETAMGRTADQDAKPANVVMLASSVEGEGKSFTSLNLSLAIAREKDFSALLIDADVAKRHLSKLFGCEERPGITDAVADAALEAEELVLGTGIPGLSFLPAGRRTSVAPELFASQRMVDLVRGLGDIDPHRIILFDSSPLLSTNESQVLSRLVDQIVLVVRAESTLQAVVLEAIQLLDKSKPVRCVLNQARTHGLTEYYYGYGYYPNDQPRA
jgi:protein-tyrosine kinase